LKKITATRYLGWFLFLTFDLVKVIIKLKVVIITANFVILESYDKNL